MHETRRKNTHRNELIGHWEFRRYFFFRMHFVWMYGPFSTHALFLMVLVKVSSMPANCAFLSMPFFSFYIIFSSLDMSVSLRHFLQMNILIIQKQRNIKKRMVLQALALSTRLNSAELRNQWSTHQEWWASISENKPLHKERERESSAEERRRWKTTTTTTTIRQDAYWNEML